MTTLALTAVHRSALAEISIVGQVSYVLSTRRFLVGGADVSDAFDQAVRDLIEAGLVCRRLTRNAPEAPVELTEAGERVAR